MRRALVVMLGLLVVSAFASAQEEPKVKPEAEEVSLPDPVELLKKTDAAAKAVKLVKYDFSFEPTGSQAANLGKAEGTVYLSGWAGNDAEKSRCEAKVSIPRSSDVHDVVVGNNGKMLFVIDNRAKTVQQNVSELRMSWVPRTAWGLRVLEFVHPTPFSDEINAKNHVLKGSTKIGDEDCYEISLDYNTTPPQSVVWVVSKKDFLPRAVERFTAGGSLKWTISNVVVDPKLEKDPFVLVVPEGYTKK